MNSGRRKISWGIDTLDLSASIAQGKDCHVDVDTTDSLPKGLKVSKK
jgi:hypothetical protein